MKYYTIDEIIKFSNEKNIENWVHEFLINSGGNIQLSNGLKKEKRYWIGPIEIDLNFLTRCCGPEDSMEFKENLDDWNKRVDKIIEKIKDSYELAPLIVEFKNDEFSIKDGNHRIDALRKSNFKKYWVVIWTNSNDDYEKVINIINK